MKTIEGIKNSMPSLGSGGRPRDYIIVGSDWDSSSVPSTLSVPSLGWVGVPIVKEERGFMVRNVTLPDTGLDGTISCEDGSIVKCMITITKVC